MVQSGRECFSLVQLVGGCQKIRSFKLVNKASTVPSLREAESTLLDTKCLDILKRTKQKKIEGLTGLKAERISQ